MSGERGGGGEEGNGLVGGRGGCRNAVGEAGVAGVRSCSGGGTGGAPRVGWGLGSGGEAGWERRGALAGQGAPELSGQRHKGVGPGLGLSSPASA